MEKQYSQRELDLFLVLFNQSVVLMIDCRSGKSLHDKPPSSSLPPFLLHQLVHAPPHICQLLQRSNLHYTSWPQPDRIPRKQRSLPNIVQPQKELQNPIQPQAPAPMHRTTKSKRGLVVLEPRIIGIHPFGLHHFPQQRQFMDTLRPAHDLLPTHEEVVRIG